METAKPSPFRTVKGETRIKVKKVAVVGGKKMGISRCWAPGKEILRGRKALFSGGGSVNQFSRQARGQKGETRGKKRKKKE